MLEKISTEERIRTEMLATIASFGAPISSVVFKVTQTPSGRTNVTIRRVAIKNIIPEAMRYMGTPNERINWKQASNAVASAGTYFLNAINKTDIWHEIQNNGRIYIPAAEKGMQFPEDFPYAAFIKMDRITK